MGADTGEKLCRGTDMRQEKSTESGMDMGQEKCTESGMDMSQEKSTGPGTEGHSPVHAPIPGLGLRSIKKIGRASCRERVSASV